MKEVDMQRASISGRENDKDKNSKIGTHLVKSWNREINAIKVLWAKGRWFKMMSKKRGGYFCPKCKEKQYNHICKALC